MSAINGWRNGERQAGARRPQRWRPIRLRRTPRRSREPRGDLTAAKLAAFGLAAEPKLIEVADDCSNNDADGRNQRMPKARKMATPRPSGSKNHGDKAEHGLDLAHTTNPLDIGAEATRSGESSPEIASQANPRQADLPP